MNDKLTNILAELRRRFEALYGERLVQMILFGSQARGDAVPGSDIDILVVLKDPVQPGEEIDRTIAPSQTCLFSIMKLSVVCSWAKSASCIGMGHFCEISAERGSGFDRRPARTA
jgi:predicted nucleotidyltransferase